MAKLTFETLRGGWRRGSEKTHRFRKAVVARRGGPPGNRRCTNDRGIVGGMAKRASGVTGCPSCIQTETDTWSVEKEAI